MLARERKKGEEGEEGRGKKETYKENIYGARHGLIMLALEIRELFADKLVRAC